MDCIERQKDREDFERVGSSTSETPAAFGLTVNAYRCPNLGCRFIVSRLPLPSHNRVKYLTLSSGERRRRRSVLREVRGTTRRQTAAE